MTKVVNKTVSNMGSCWAQLVRWLLQTPEIHSSNPLISKFYFLSIELKRKKALKELKLKITYQF